MRRPNVNPQHEDGEGELQAQAPGDRLHADGAAVGGEDVGQAQHGEQAENAGESSHSVFLPQISSNHSMNQRSSCSRRSVGRDLIALIKQLPGTGGLRFGIAVNRAKRFAGRNLVADFLVQTRCPPAGSTESSLLLAAAAEDHAGRANLLRSAIAVTYPALRAGHFHRVSGRRQPRRDRRCARRRRLAAPPSGGTSRGPCPEAMISLSDLLALRNRLGGSAQVEHPGRQFEAQLAQDPPARRRATPRCTSTTSSALPTMRPSG